MFQWVLLLSIFIWLIVLTYYLYKTIIHYRNLIKGTNSYDLTKALDKILEEQRGSKEKIDGLEKGLLEQIKKGSFFVQKVGILRFNPFEDTGGDQSFVLAILDGTDSGIVLTSLHSRGNTRWYAKNVKNGKGIDHQLSQDEEKAIKKARLSKSDQ